jgi:hypothetical protein
MQKLFYLISLFYVNLASAGIYVENPWPQNEVTVCFAKEEKNERRINNEFVKARSWKKQDKVKVMNWVNEEFRHDRTGIFFTGWHDCELSPNADIVLLYHKNKHIFSKSDGLHGVSGSFGPARKAVDGFHASRGIISISSTGMNKGTTVHEFGHAAGLLHEHQHPNAIPLKGCEWWVKPNLPNRTDDGFEIRYSAFDEHSIMSYCTLNVLQLNTLSKRDIVLLKKLYP